MTEAELKQKTNIRFYDYSLRLRIEGKYLNRRDMKEANEWLVFQCCQYVKKEYLAFNISTMSTNKHNFYKYSLTILLL